MSSSRRLRRHLAATNNHQEIPVHELTREESDEALEAVDRLTEEIVQFFHNDDIDDIDDYVNEKLGEIGDQYGGAGYLSSLLSASMALASHIFDHYGSVAGIDQALDAVPNLHRKTRRKVADMFVKAILAEIVGKQDSVSDVITETSKTIGPEVGPVVAGIWQAFTWLGGEHGVGIEWCDPDTIDLNTADTVDDMLPETEEWEDHLVDVHDVAGIVSATVELLGLGKTELADQLIVSAVAQGLAPDLHLALLLLEAGAVVDVTETLTDVQVPAEVLNDDETFLHETASPASRHLLERCKRVAGERDGEATRQLLDHHCEKLDDGNDD